MRHSLEIAFFGSSLVSAYQNGAATYYRGIVRALAARGHRITFYEPDLGVWQRHRDIAEPSWAEVVSYSSSDPGSLDHALERSRRADVVINASRVGAFDAVLDREVPRSVKPGALAIYWDVDVATTLARLRANADDPLREQLPRYDLVLTNGGGPPVVRQYIELGAQLAVPIYPALDPTTHYPVASESRWFADLSLVLNRQARKDCRMSDLFFRVASLAPEKSFLLGGKGWEADVLPDNVRAIGHLYTGEHNVFNSGARCVLAASRDLLGSGWCPPARLFEAAGAGACLLTNGWSGLDSFFEPGREILVANEADEALALLQDLERRPTRAREVGAAGRARALSQHTYFERARLVDSILVSSAPLEAAS
jgi:spore maturation protein CgeB